MKPQPFTLSLLAALAFPAALLAGNGSVVRSPLTNTGIDSDASGVIFSSLNEKISVLSVELAKLAPKAAYSLTVGELREATFTTDSKGRARLRFTTGNSKSKTPLDFDPRGKAVTVLDTDGAAVLQAVVSGEGESETIAVDERADLLAQTGVKGKADARYTAQKNGKRSFNVTVSGTTETTLALFVNGIARGDIVMRGKSGKVIFYSAPRAGQLLLDFDPRNAQVELFGADGTLKFGGKLEAKAKGVNFDTRSTRSELIPGTPAAPVGARAEAKLRIESDATRDFSVELEDVSVGAYELLVNDNVEGTIDVTRRAEGGTQGELEFTTDDDDDAGELPLNFNPVGATLTIRQGATVLFTGGFNPSVGNKAPRPVPGTTTLITEALASTGLDSNAKGEAEFSIQTNGEMEFEVEVEDVDAGKYQLFVGGTLRGTIAALLDNNGRVRGKLKFEKAGLGEDRTPTRRGRGGDDGDGDDNGGGGGGTDDPAGDDNGSGGEDGRSSGGGGREPRLPLNFDPRGQLIEIKTEAGVFFSHVLGDGSAPSTGGGGTTVVPGEITVALISSGADANATAEAEWKRNDRGDESFEVEVEDLNVGSYELLIGDTVRGTINVIATDRGTRGRIEFDDEPDAGEQPLTFEPLGQIITVQAGGTIYFQRTFPAGS